MLRLVNDRTLLDTFGFTELHEASLGISKQPFGNSLMSCPRAAIDEVDAGQRSTLSWAAQRGDLDVIQQLLSRGADPNKPDGCGMTPLHWAGKNGGLAAMTALLKAGANINQNDHCDQTALMYAVKFCDDLDTTKMSPVRIWLRRTLMVGLQSISRPGETGLKCSHILSKAALIFMLKILWVTHPSLTRFYIKAMMH